MKQVFFWKNVQRIYEVSFWQVRKAGDSYEFSCQHGPVECLGNTVHNCAVKYVQSPLPYIKCMMENNYDPMAIGKQVGRHQAAFYKIRLMTISAYLWDNHTQTFTNLTTIQWLKKVDCEWFVYILKNSKPSVEQKSSKSKFWMSNSVRWHARHQLGSDREVCQQQRG